MSDTTKHTITEEEIKKIVHIQSALFQLFNNPESPPSNLEILQSLIERTFKLGPPIVGFFMEGWENTVTTFYFYPTVLIMAIEIFRRIGIPLLFHPKTLFP